MQLTKDKVAVLNYVLKNDDGNIIDESNDNTFCYLHGANNIIPGLENALEGKQAGDEVTVSIEAADAYGERDLANIQKVPRDMFPEDIDIQAGMQFQAQSSQGHPLNVTVTAVEANEIVVDGNHPLAGMRLHFDVQVIEVRDASPEEISNGHVNDSGEHLH